MDVVRVVGRSVVVLLLTAHCPLPTAHCQAPELPPIGERPREPARPAAGGSGPARLGAPAAEAPAAAPGPEAPGGADLELVEQVIAARRAYANSLQALHEHYRKAGDARRAQMAEDELRAFHRAPHPVYRLELDVPSPGLRPLHNQKEANDLLRWALTFKDRGVGPEFADNQRRAEIVLQELLTKYPQSNKIPEAAYLLGELYEGRAFRQYERAAAYYERCFQWDPNTKSDARLRAARIYDRDLKDRRRAVELYRLVLEHDTIPARRQEATRRLADLGAR